MSREFDTSYFCRDTLLEEGRRFLSHLQDSHSLEEARKRVFNRISDYQYDAEEEGLHTPLDERVIVRDCARALRSLLKESSDAKSGFSVIQTLLDLAQGLPRPDLEPGFFAQMIHLIRGVEGRPTYCTPGDFQIDPELSGREAARVRSDQLDRVWARVSEAMSRFEDGLGERAIARRQARKEKILNVLGAKLKDWNDWRWHLKGIIKTPEALGRLVDLRLEEYENIRRAKEAHLPFGITPYYVSLMDDRASARDRSIRSQVLPPRNYIEEMSAHRPERDLAFDFMLERDTSPVDLVTRRYPSIVILKPYNTCPQICVYCQRNWEIEDAMDPHALAPSEKIEEAIHWIEAHPAINEVLVTGGDPLILSDSCIEELMARLAQISSVDLIRIGTRVPVTIPMRITLKLAKLLGHYREPGRREVALVTHVQHPYEITPEMVAAVQRLRRQGLGVYNQLVYTFFVSRRFEAAKLRLLLRRVGIDPYYTFIPKGKEETRSYRVPLARIVQEMKEEARLLPGLRRTDEAVYNVPRLGKNYLRAFQHRDMISLLPNGARVYEFHPWEKMVAQREGYVGVDVPILEYLSRLHELGENPQDYESIWYYF